MAKTYRNVSTFKDTLFGCAAITGNAKLISRSLDISQPDPHVLGFELCRLIAKCLTESAGIRPFRRMIKRLVSAGAKVSGALKAVVTLDQMDPWVAQISRRRGHYNGKDSGRVELIQYLAKAGATVRVGTLSFAARCRHPDVVSILLDAGADVQEDDENPLWNAVHFSTYPARVAQLLLEKGADVHINEEEFLRHAVDRAGATIDEEMTELARVWLDYGADVRVDNDELLKPVTVHHRGRESLLPLLLASGANVHVDDDKLLRRAPSATVARVLLEHGANVHACDDEALRRACREGDVDMVQLLLEYGADVHANKMKGCGMYGNPGAIGAGANVNAGGGYALRVAVQYGWRELVDLLVAAGASAGPVDEIS
ncbi:hypothetical protein HDV00_012259 [Rhizophlyctis rosea]|nr:hypothetical protein HDV00_012259 [Rhizophlyctis rosea]